MDWWKAVWRAYAKRSEPLTPKYTLRTGTGLIIDSNGLVVTNEHLVNGADLIIARLSDGRKFPAQVVAQDQWFDLAIVIIPAKGLKVPVYGNSKNVKVGQQVLLMGNALGFANTVSQGIISGKERYVPDEFGRIYENLFQTDAAMNFGDSGGPLLNMDGEVIGLNVAIIPEGQNISFAMPIDDCRKLVSELLREGKIKRGWIGLKVAERRGRGGRTELQIDGWQNNSPAASLGFLQKDILVDVNGFQPRSSLEFYKYVRDHLPGDSLVLRIMRNNTALVKTANVASFPVPAMTAPRTVNQHAHGGFVDHLLPNTRWMVLLTAFMCLWLLYRFRYARRLAFAAEGVANRRLGERRKGERRKGERRKILPNFLNFPQSLDRRRKDRRKKERRTDKNRRSRGG
ncbi:MAG: serine protease [Candidatus Omnitrophica bacterium]|nr:serine protease [Candidatus Omnitrophota bacterium]